MRGVRAWRAGRFGEVVSRVKLVITWWLVGGDSAVLGVDDLGVYSEYQLMSISCWFSLVLFRGDQDV